VGGSSEVIRKFLENNCGDFIDTEARLLSADMQLGCYFVLIWNQTLLVLTSSLTRQEQFDVDCYTDSRFSIADSFVAGACDATYFRGAKDPFKPRSLNTAGSSVELSSPRVPSNWANQVPMSKAGSMK
jgi:hypothetical protein